MSILSKGESTSWIKMQDLDDTPSGALPIFYQDQKDCLILYSPGYVVQVDKAVQGAFLKSVRSLGKDKRWNAVTELIRYAAHAKSTQEKIITSPFAPTCLTLYLNNQCNLHCSYCFSNASLTPTRRLDLDFVHSCAQLVAQNCSRASLPFTIVFHGGGEPVLRKDAAESVLNEIDKALLDFQLPVIRCLATNGVMSRQKAEWIASRFDLIGVSCDGPDFIQNYQRPLQGGQGSSHHVERTCKIIRDAGKKLYVRVTLTPASYLHLPEIAEYICQSLKPDEIHVEAVYQGGRAEDKNCFSVEQADLFVQQYSLARQVCKKYSTSWSSSGSRPHEIHGPYCNIFRNVLNLVPGNFATACFKVTDGADRLNAPFLIGNIDKHIRKSAVVIDYPKIEAMKNKVKEFEPRCRDCFNQYHCTYTCPDTCSLLEAIGDRPVFRCEVQKMLMDQLIKESLHDYANVQIPDAGVISGPIKCD